MQLDEVRHITPDKLQRVLGLLKTSFTHMVIDTSKSYRRTRHARVIRSRRRADVDALDLALPPQRQKAPADDPSTKRKPFARR